MCLLTNLIQQLNGKALLCDSGHLHDITSGRPLDSSIECATTAKTILDNFLTREGHRLTWSCAPCRKTYRSGTLSCSSPACSKLKGSTKMEATSHLLTQIDRMVLEAVEPCEGQEDPVVINPASPPVRTQNVIAMKPSLRKLSSSGTTTTPWRRRPTR